METTEFRLSAVERAVGDIRTAIDRIADAMAQIARLEEKHTETRDAIGRAFSEIGELKRETAHVRMELVAIRGELKPLQESRSWINAAMLGIVALVGTAVIGLVLIQR